MPTRNLVRLCTALALVATSLIAGCAGDTPEKLVASGRDYLAKQEPQAATIQLKNALQKNSNLAEARYLLGIALLESGDSAGAKQELQRALTLKYSADEVHPVLARAMLNLGEYKEIVTRYADADVGTPERNAELRSVVGMARLAQRDVAAAQADFEKSASLRPGHLPALMGMVRTKALQRDIPGALAVMQTTLDAYPKRVDVHHLHGELLAATGQPTAAFDAFAKSLAWQPNYVPAHVATVALHLQLNQFDEASRQLDELKKLAPKHPDTLLLQASLNYGRKNTTAAREAILLHLKDSPNNVRGLLLAAAIEHQAKSYAQSEAYVIRAQALVPNLVSAQRIQINNFLRSGQHNKAIEALKPLLASTSPDAQTLALAGETYLASGKPSDAAAYFAKATELDPNDDRKVIGLAASHLAQGKADEAFRELEEAAAAGNSDRAAIALIAAAMGRRDFDRALSAIAALEKKRPGTALPLNLRGAALLGKRDVDGARKQFERALELEPTYFPAAANLAKLDLVAGHHDAARKRFESILAKNPKSTESYLALAELHLRQRGASEEAVALYNKAIAVNPTAAAPRVALINHYIVSKQTSKAVAAAQEALAAVPNRVEMLDAAGRAYLTNGSGNQALSIYGEWARLEPKSPLPLVRLAEVHMVAKNYDAATEPLKKALQLKPDALDAQQRSIELALVTNRTPQALETAKTIQKQRPKAAIGYMLEGAIHARSKAYPEAAAAYRTGLKAVDSTDLAVRLHSALRMAKNKDADTLAADRLKRPDGAVFRVYLAESALAERDYPSAIQHYHKLLETQPSNAAWLNNLAYAAGRAGDLKATEYAEKAVALAPNNPAILDTLGVLLVDRGDTVRGVELLQKAASLSQAPGIRLNLAKGLIKAGQKSAARRELESLAVVKTPFAGREEVERLLKVL